MIRAQKFCNIWHTSKGRCPLPCPSQEKNENKSSLCSFLAAQSGLACVFEHTFVLALVLSLPRSEEVGCPNGHRMGGCDFGSGKMAAGPKTKICCM